MFSQSSRAILVCPVYGPVMWRLSIEIDPGLPAVLAPGVLQGLDLVRWRDAEAIQGRMVARTETPPAPWTMGSLQHGHSIEVVTGWRFRAFRIPVSMSSS